VFLTSDCLSVEKREGTLGLLFLTDLRAYDVVLGKFVIGSARAFFALLAMFPLLTLALLAGSVTGAECWRLLLVCLASLFLSTSVGMVVSAFSREARDGIGRTLLVLLGLTGVGPAVWLLVSLIKYIPSLDFLRWISPAYAYRQAFESAYATRRGAADYWFSLSLITAIGLGCLIAACLVLPRGWKDLPAAAPGANRPAGAFRRRRNRKAPPPALADHPPCYWLAIRDSAPLRRAWQVFVWLIPLWLVSLLTAFATSRSEAFVITLFTAYGLHQTIKILIATEASRRMNEDRQSGAWELLLVTPLPVPAILHGQTEALRNQFRRPIWALAAVNGAMVAAVLLSGERVHINPNELGLFLLVFIGGAATAWADSGALIRVGMWQGLNARQHPRAIAETLGLVMGVPWMLIFLFPIIAPRFHSNGDAATALVIWFALGLVLDLAVGASSGAKLRARFRATLARRFTAPMITPKR